MSLDHKRILSFFLSMVFVLQSCSSTKNYYRLPALVSETTLNAVIEIPAGTNTKYEYHPSTKTFEIDQENGKDRIIDFLPYPGNYGFIPSTLSKRDMGGDGDALDVLVISEAVQTGTILEIIPIAFLKLIDDGEMDYKVIAIPQNKSNRIIRATNYAELIADYPKLLEIIELWFLNYNPNDSSSVEG